MLERDESDVTLQKSFAHFFWIPFWVGGHCPLTNTQISKLQQNHTKSTHQIGSRSEPVGGWLSFEVANAVPRCHCMALGPTNTKRPKQKCVRCDEMGGTALGVGRISAKMDACKVHQQSSTNSSPFFTGEMVN